MTDVSIPPANSTTGEGWRPIASAPKEGRFIGRSSSADRHTGKLKYTRRITWWGKASHIGWWGWCSGKGEDVYCWSPTHWKPNPPPAGEGTKVSKSSNATCAKRSAKPTHRRETEMPKHGPKHKVPLTASVDRDGFPVCCFPTCEKRLRYQFGGWGYNGSGHFCSKTCAAEWADITVESTSHD